MGDAGCQALSTHPRNLMYFCSCEACFSNCSLVAVELLSVIYNWTPETDSVKMCDLDWRKIQWLIMFAALVEAPNSVPSTHMVPYSHL